ncbi:MAG: hypothetical protein DWQ34_18395 [Planctomycetota bacterium]|nr:MAG: hypothetical protein DWQ29_24585 [Planctomycetota bacterium]REJ89924.1 MAG: hypothetical protein DWQ34_18395 [Planctomycetota bacterium]REK21543.1 MAG: hypothetical protein DWQ41_20955 [Planctomycetota bacterium]REK39902.1 MAG: hypothetical protein DWQ45_01140 [Planctomycetota bacterium]
MNWLQKLASAANSADGSADLESAKQISREFFGAAAEKSGAWKRKATQRFDAAAEKLAQTCSEWTGRETSAADVKRATKIGAVVGAVVAAGPVVGMAMRQARANGLPAGGQPGLTGGASEGILPSVAATDPSQEWEQDDIAYDQMQYDNLQDHLAHQDQLHDVIDDQISYNASLDYGGGSFD